jgi:hypothetical protein
MLYFICFRLSRVRLPQNVLIRWYSLYHLYTTYFFLTSVARGKFYVGKMDGAQFHWHFYYFLAPSFFSTKSDCQTFRGFSRNGC